MLKKRAKKDVPHNEAHPKLGRPAICPYSATMLPNSLQGYVALYASSDSAGTWSVAEEMGVS